jgi:hypothetical protein
MGMIETDVQLHNGIICRRGDRGKTKTTLEFELLMTAKSYRCKPRVYRNSPFLVESEVGRFGALTKRWLVEGAWS